MTQQWLGHASFNTAAIYSAWLYTKRRFGPTAFYQAFLNVFTIAGALLSMLPRCSRETCTSTG